MSQLHHLLLKQLRTHLGAKAEPSPELRPLLEAISASYVQSDEDRALLERSLAMVQSTLESTDVGILVVDNERKALTVNQAYADLWNTTREHLLAATPQDRVALALEFLKEPERIVSELVGLYSVPDTSNHQVLEFRDGRVFELSSQPFLVRGRVAGRVWSFHDITKRTRAVAALRDSERRYRTLFENNPHSMWAYDLETFAFLAVNDAAVHHYGYSREEFLAMTVMDIRPAADLPAFRKRIAQIKPGVSLSGEWRHVKKDGSLIVVDISSHQLLFDGRPAALVLANDVTARRQLEHQFRQSQKLEAVGQLAGGIAHDFNNLLTAILGYSQLLKDRLAQDREGLSDVDEIEKAAGRATALTNQLLAFSRKQVLQPRVMDLNIVLDDVQKMLHRLIGADIDLTVRPGADLLRVTADPGQIEQVLVNLAVNARDAMPDGGALIFETSNVHVDENYVRTHADAHLGTHVLMAISDTGCGMSKEVLGRIFEPFFTTKEMGKGTGLGLSTVHGIITQSGGHIEVYSEIGKGTTFKIYLPALTEAVEHAEPVAERPKCRGGSETILVVEDEAPVRAVLAHMLRSNGYQVIEAPDGPEALTLIERDGLSIDLVISDVVMPKMSGTDFVRLFRKRQPAIRVIYMSGYTDHAVIHRGVKAAEMAFLQKPFTSEVLLTKVRETLDGPAARAA